MFNDPFSKHFEVFPHYKRIRLLKVDSIVF